MTELDPDAKALFDAARDALDPPHGAEARIFPKIGAAAGVSAATLATSISAASQPASALLAKLSNAWWLLPKAHAVSISLIALGSTAVVVSVGVQRHWHAEAAAHRAESAASVTAHQNVSAQASARVAPRTVQHAIERGSAPSSAALEPVPSSAATATFVAPNAAPRAVAPAVIAVQRAPRFAAEPAERATSPSASATLATGSAAFESETTSALPTPPRSAQNDAEIALIREMQAAFGAGQDSRLASAIAEHRRRFPQGMLSEEREALSAMLECRQSPTRASRIGARFSTRFARSPYEARVNRACRIGSSEEK